MVSPRGGAAPAAPRAARSKRTRSARALGVRSKSTPKFADAVPCNSSKPSAPTNALRRQHRPRRTQNHSPLAANSCDSTSHPFLFKSNNVIPQARILPTGSPPRRPTTVVSLPHKRWSRQGGMSCDSRSAPSPLAAAPASFRSSPARRPAAAGGYDLWSLPEPLLFLLERRGI